jgi:hypothetical protein
LIIRIFLKLFFASLIVLIIADIFYQLHLRAIANLIIQLGDDVLLLSIVLFLGSGIVFFAKQIKATIKRYFSAKQRAQRCTFFNIAQHDYLQRLFALKKQQLFYFAKLKREKLLDNDNKKQAALLAKAILKKLMTVKHQLSDTQFKQYQQIIKKTAAQQKIQRLLELQQEISTLDLS